MSAVNTTQKTEAQIAEEVSRPSCYFEPPNLIIRASALGNCPLRLAHIALGRTEHFPDAVLAAFSAGHVFEEVALNHLQSIGILTRDRQRTAEVQMMPGIISRGHVDAMLDNCDNARWDLVGLPTFPPHQGMLSYSNMVCEIKSASPQSFEKFRNRGLDDFPNYKTQLAIYTTALSFTGCVIFFIQKETMEVLGRCYSLLELTLLIPALKEKCWNTLLAINTLQQGGKLLCNEFKQQVFPCPFDDLHDENITTLADLNFECMLDDYAQLSAQAAEIKERQDDIKKLVAQKLNSTGGGKMRCGVHTVQMIQGRESVDYTSIRRAHPELCKWEDENKRRGADYMRIDSRGRKAE